MECGNSETNCVCQRSGYKIFIKCIAVVALPNEVIVASGSIGQVLLCNMVHLPNYDHAKISNNRVH